MNNKPYCYAPFVHLYQDYSTAKGDTYLDYKICCVARHTVPSDNNTLEHKWNSKYLQDVRKRMLDPKGKLPECETCQLIEENGAVSDRIHYHNRFDNTGIELDIEQGNQYGGPIDFDLRLNNLCNLKCRMCGSSSSSQYDKEFKKHQDTLKPFYVKHGIKHIHKNLVQYEDVDEVDDKKNVHYLKSVINSGRLERIKFLGGEPTIMPGVTELLEHMIEKKQTDVELFFTTNCTNDNTRFVDLIKQFTKVRFHYSVDGIEDTVEYIRAPVKWKTINEHIDVLTDLTSSEFNSEVNMTIQAYNIHNLKDYVYWLRDVNTRTNKTVGMNTVVLYQPYYMSYDVLPLEYRNKYLQELLDDPIMNWEVIKQGPLKSSLTMMLKNQTVNSEAQQAFIDGTRVIDKIRNQNIGDYIPELEELVYGQ